MVKSLRDAADFAFRSVEELLWCATPLRSLRLAESKIRLAPNPKPVYQQDLNFGMAERAANDVILSDREPVLHPLSAFAGIGRMAHRFARQSARTLLPARCLTCDEIVEDRGAVCASCWQGLRFIEKPYCGVLGSPFSYDLGSGALSAEAIADPPAFDRLRSTLLYDAEARRLVQGLKFSDRTDLGPWMARWMHHGLLRNGDGLLDDKPLIIPVPLHRRRLLSRRFNQSAELARHLAHLAECPFVPDYLRRIRPTQQQVGLGQKQRQRNVSGAFLVPEEHKPAIQGRPVLLVDDVYTTGATMQACARALKRAKPLRIDCVTFARVASGEI